MDEGAWGVEGRVGWGGGRDYFFALKENGIDLSAGISAALGRVKEKGAFES